MRIFGLDISFSRQRQKRHTQARSFSLQEVMDIINQNLSTSPPEKITGVESAYANIAQVYRCVSILRDAGSVPVEVLDRKTGKVLTEGKAVEWTVNPFPGMTWGYWLGLVIAQIKLTGGCRGVVITEDPLAIMPYSLNACVAVQENPPVYPPRVYRVGQEQFPRERVVEFMPACPISLFDAVAPLEACLQSARIIYQADKHCVDTLLTGAMITGLLMLKRQFATPQEFQHFVAAFAEQLKNAKKRGGVVVLDGVDAELRQLGWSLADLKLLELAEASKKDIVIALGVQPAMVGDSAVRFANFKEQRISFLEDTLRPLWRLISTTLNTYVAPRFGDDITFRLKEEQSYVTQSVWVEHARGLTDVVGRVMTVNEARHRLGLLPIGEEGDRLERPFTVITYDATPSSDEGRRVKEGVDALRRYLRQNSMEERKPVNGLNGRPPFVRQQYWRIFDAQFSGFIPGYKQAFSRLFRATIEALKDSATANWEKYHTVPYDRSQFDKAAMNIRMRFIPAIWREARKTGAQEIEDLTRTHREYELPSDVLDTIRRRAERWTEKTGDATFQAIDAIIREGVEEGWDLKRMIAEIENEMLLTPERAERIARTEVLGSLNEGKLSVYDEAGVAMKEWLAVQDDRTRDEHSEADGQTVPLDMPFSVGGELLRFPGDPDGSPENIINCRCSVLPVL